MAGAVESLREEMEPFGVDVTCIFLATYQTPLNTHMRKAEPTQPYKKVYDFLATGEAMQPKLPDSDNLDSYARAVLEMVGSRKPPDKIVIGSGGAKQVRDKLEAELKEFDAWAEVSGYTKAA